MVMKKILRILVFLLLGAWAFNASFPLLTLNLVNLRLIRQMQSNSQGDTRLVLNALATDLADMRNQSNHLSIQRRLGWLYVRLGENDLARPVFDRLTEDASQNPFVFADAVQVYSSLGIFKDVVQLDADRRFPTMDDGTRDRVLCSLFRVSEQASLNERTTLLARAYSLQPKNLYVQQILSPREPNLLRGMTQAELIPVSPCLQEYNQRAVWTIWNDGVWNSKQVQRILSTWNWAYGNQPEWMNWLSGVAQADSIDGPWRWAESELQQSSATLDAIPFPSNPLLPSEVSPLLENHLPISLTLEYNEDFSGYANGAQPPDWTWENLATGSPYDQGVFTGGIDTLSGQGHTLRIQGIWSEGLTDVEPSRAGYFWDAAGYQGVFLPPGQGLAIEIFYRSAEDGYFTLWTAGVGAESIFGNPQMQLPPTNGKWQRIVFAGLNPNNESIKVRPLFLNWSMDTLWLGRIRLYRIAIK